MGVFQSTMNEEKEDNFIGRFEHIHIQQQKDWDCGIACFLMAQVSILLEFTSFRTLLHLPSLSSSS